jgi:hypothetical protein
MVEFKKFYNQILSNIKEFKETKRFGFLTKSFVLLLIIIIPGSITISAAFLFLKSYFDLKSE